VDRTTQQTSVDTRVATSDAAEPVGRHVALLGLMGAGKTAVGTQLATALGVRFDDNDSRLAAVSGLTPRELRNRDGIAVLHSLEAKHFLGALRSPTPGVVSGAASVVENRSCREALRNPEICAIWLRVEPATLASRFHREAHRPIYSDDLQRFFDDQLAARAPLYQQVSDSVIDTDGLTVAEVVELVLPIVDEHLDGVSRPV
jgi:shikimate kinase